VASNVSDGWSVLAIVAKQLENKVLEIVRKVLTSRLLPVGSVVALKKEIVEILVFLGLLEWEDALDNDEEDDASREHVDLHAIIGLAFLDFWSHVSHGASVRLEIVNFPESCESEVSDLQVHVVVNQNVFELEVTMDDALSMHVFQHIAHLGEEEATTIFAHASQSLAYVEEQATGNKLEENVYEVFNLSAGWLHDLAVRAITKNLNDILVFKSLQDLDLLLDGLDRIGVSLQELLSEKF